METDASQPIEPYGNGEASSGRDALGRLTGADFEVRGGFWLPGCLADVNGDLEVDVNDLVQVIVAWGPC